MSFADLVSTADRAVLATFGEQSVTIHFQDHHPDMTISCLVSDPKLEEDYMPGSPQGTAVLLLFVRPADAGDPIVKGDTATYVGLDYDIYQVDADLEGGAILRMRKRNQRFDQ